MKKIANAQATDGGLDKPESTLIEVLSQQLRKLHEIGHERHRAKEGPMIDFIFMLTRHDQTIEDCLETADYIADIGLQHVGFKDVGADLETLKTLTGRIRDMCGPCRKGQIQHIVSLTNMDVTTANVAYSNPCKGGLPLIKNWAR